MTVYRLSKEKYKDDLSGMGAERYGGRWNSKGKGMIYTADSRALAKLEVAVHVALYRMPRDYYMVVLDIPDEEIVPYDITRLQGKDWKHNPPIKFTQTEGDLFLEERNSLVLKVPSTLVEGDFNLLINPEHAKAKRLKILGSQKFDFDMRLFR